MPPAYTLHAANGTFHLARGQVQTQPAPGATQIDLTRFYVLPGLVNPHDHLELNHYPRTKFRDRYPNAHQWGDDVDTRLQNGLYAQLRAYPIADRCWIGGLKNLLSGVTTVAHHGPLYPSLRRHDFPVRVLQRYGWAHSLHFDPPQQVRASYLATPPAVPWFIHLAEGTDPTAAAEYAQLKALGCAGPNTVIVHGVGLTPDDLADAAGRVRGIIRCPTTNRYLLGQTADPAPGVRCGVGSDSRLTADGDLLQEPDATTPLTQAANRAILGVGKWDHADLIVCHSPSPARHRAQLNLVMRSGIPQWGDPALMAAFKQFRSVRATLDSVPKSVNRQLARQYQRCKLDEPGFALLAPGPRFWL
jgi:hypothetical protein